MNERIKKSYRKKSKNGDYINSDELLKETLLSKQNCQMTDRFAELLMILHDHILLRDEFKTKNEDEKQEIKSWSIYTIAKYISRGLKTFKDDCTPRESFNYFTRSARLNMIRRSQALHKQEENKNKYIDKMIQKQKESINYNKE